MPALLERLKRLQREESAVNERILQAQQLVPLHPREAHQRLRRVERRAERLARNWETWLGEAAADDAWRSAVEPFARDTGQRMAETRSFVATGKGQALTFLGRLAEAEAAYRDAMALLGGREIPSEATLAEASAVLCLQRGLFARAEEQGRRAYAVYRRYAAPDAWDPLVAPEDREPAARLSCEGAARALGLLAQAALIAGDREAYLRREAEAIAFAERHGIAALARRARLNRYHLLLLWDAAGNVPDEVRRTLRDDAECLGTDHDAQLDRLLLEAAVNIERGSVAAAERQLNRAKDILRGSEALHSKWWNLHLTFARCFEAQGRLEDAIRSAADALEVARQQGWPELIQGALDTLVLLRLSTNDAGQRVEAARELGLFIERMRPLERTEVLARALLQRALVHVAERRFQAALADIDEAEACARTRDVLRLVLAARGGALQRAGRSEEALAAVVQAIRLGQEQRLPAGEPSPAAWRDLLHQTESLHAGAALLAAELGRVHEAFRWAEEGRVRLLRQQLAQAGRAVGEDGPRARRTSAETWLRAFLRRESAAILMFSVGPTRMLALLFDPEADEPQAFFADLAEEGLREEDLRESAWADTERFRDLLARLSAKLFAGPLGAKLQRVMDRCRVLHIAPDSRLYLVPFAALTLGDRLLVEHDRCALALAPSIAILQHCLARRRPRSERTCLAAGVGTIADAQGRTLSFAQQARETMAGCRWGQLVMLADDEAVTLERFWDEARRCDVLHLSCHGIEQPTELDTLSALQLDFSGGERLQARDVFDRRGQLRAELVFLNACMSGRFRLRQGNAVGGFWQAFLHAGAGSLIATLARITPDAAQRIATEFYRSWLDDGVSRAHALQRAQRSLRRQDPDSLQWARHILIGDHR